MTFLTNISHSFILVHQLLRLYTVLRNNYNFATIFTALHVMQTRYSDENSVCPSVRPSVRLSATRVNCDKTVERSVQIYTPHERTFSLVI